MINKIIKRNDIECDNVVSYSTTYFNKSMFPKKYYEESKYFEFEGKKFLGTKYYDEYLTYLYGDYMKLPPKEKRITHDIIEIDYGE